MNAHTPGPWHHYPINMKDHRYAIWKDGVRVALVDRRPQHAEAENEANARLIAQAPRMLAELEEVSHWHDLLKQNYPEMIGLISAAREARAILRAVKGE